MPFEFSVYALLLGCISFFSLVLIIYVVVSRQKSELSCYFVLVLTCTFIWSSGYALEIAATDMETIHYLNFITYIGILFLPPFVLFYAISLTRRLKILQKPLSKLVLFFMPCLSYVFLLTNESHLLFYQNIELNTTGPFVSRNLIYGPIFYLQMTYNYILIGFAITLVVYTLIKTPKEDILFRRQLLFNIIGSLFPITGNFIRITRIFPSIAFIDLTPFFFVIWFILCAYAIFEMEFLDIIPIAREKIFDEIGLGLLVLDREIRIIDANPKAQEIIMSKKIYGRGIFDVLKDNSQIKDLQTVISDINTSLTSLHSKQTSLEEVNIVISYPHTIAKKTYKLIISPVFDSGKIPIVGYVFIFQDISANVNLAVSLEEKTKLLEMIIHLLSHDIRNQITVVTGYAEMSLKKTVDEKITKFMKAIILRNKSTIQLLEEITNYLIIETELYEEIFHKMCVNDVIKDIIDQLRFEIDSKEITLIEDYISEEAFILANITFTSVIYNLLMNAIKFSPRCGTITIKICDIENRWRIQIGDEGPGIEDNLKKEVFKPFRRFGKNKGIGLGLTIVKEILQFFRSEIWIENREPTGTIFVFEIAKYPE